MRKTPKITCQRRWAFWSLLVASVALTLPGCIGESLDHFAIQTCDLADPAWRVAPAELVSGVNSPYQEGEPFLSYDGRLLYFYSVRNFGNLDGYVATRIKGTDQFENVVENRLVNTPDRELRYAESFSGKEAFLSTDRAGGAGGFDLWMATRASTDSPFEQRDFAPIASVNTPNDEFDPFLTTDGKSLYFTGLERSDGMGVSDLYIAARASSGEFKPATHLKELNSASQDNNPTVGSDGRFIIFDSNRSGNLDLWFATRRSTDDPFDAPKPLSALNTGKDDVEPFLSRDGCEIYFASDRASSSEGDWDLYRAKVVRAQ